MRKRKSITRISLASSASGFPQESANSAHPHLGNVVPGTTRTPRRDGDLIGKTSYHYHLWRREVAVSWLTNELTVSWRKPSSTGIYCFGWLFPRTPEKISGPEVGVLAPKSLPHPSVKLPYLSVKVRPIEWGLDIFPLSFLFLNPGDSSDRLLFF